MTSFFFYQQTRLHRKLRERRVEALDQLKSQSEDVKKIETAIFSSGQRLGAVLKENHRCEDVSLSASKQIIVALGDSSRLDISSN